MSPAAAKLMTGTILAFYLKYYLDLFTKPCVACQIFICVMADELPTGVFVEGGMEMSCFVPPKF